MTTTPSTDELREMLVKCAEAGDRGVMPDYSNAYARLRNLAPSLATDLIRAREEIERLRARLEVLAEAAGELRNDIELIHAIEDIRFVKPISARTVQKLDAGMALSATTYPALKVSPNVVDNNAGRG